MREMIAVRVYKDGRIKIEPASPYLATQELYFSDEDGIGFMYYCKKDKAEFYANKLVRKREKKIQEEMKQLKQAKERVRQELERLKEEGAI